MAISHRDTTRPNLSDMQQRITSHQDSGQDDGHDDKRAPLSERAWQNQRGILLAVALTLAAVGVLVNFKV